MFFIPVRAVFSFHSSSKMTSDRLLSALNLVSRILHSVVEVPIMQPSFVRAIILLSVRWDWDFVCMHNSRTGFNNVVVPGMKSRSHHFFH